VPGPPIKNTVGAPNRSVAQPERLNPIGNKTNEPNASAMRYKLWPSREVVCPVDSKANGRCFKERSTFMVREYSIGKESSSVIVNVMSGSGGK